MEAIVAVKNIAYAVVKIRPEKIWACMGFERTHDLCDSGVV